MKRFAFFFNMHGQRLNNIPWFVENFKFIPFRPNVEDLNDYEFIWIYTCPGTNTEKVNERFKWNEAPKYLRKKGIKVPIVYQEDYYHIDQWTKQEYSTYFYANYALEHVDGIIHGGARNWSHLPKPVFYIQAPPLSIPDTKWVDFDDKHNAAVSVLRLYGNNSPSKDVADRLHLPHNELGKNVPRKPQKEYLEYIASHKIGLDYNDLYFGWSRFVAEAAYVGTPVIGPLHRKGCQVATPAFCGPIGGEKLVKIRKFLTDKAYYETIRQAAYLNVKNHLSPEACAKRIQDMIISLGIEL